MGIDSKARHLLLNRHELKNAILHEIPKGASQVYFDLSQLWHCAKDASTTRLFYEVFLSRAENAFADGALDVIFFADDRHNVPTLKFLEQAQREKEAMDGIARMYVQHGMPMPDVATLSNLRLLKELDASVPHHWKLALTGNSTARGQMFADVARHLLTYTKIPSGSALIVYGVAGYSSVPLVKKGDNPDVTYHLPTYVDDIGESELRILRWVNLARQHWRTCRDMDPYVTNSQELNTGTIIISSVDGDFLPILLSTACMRSPKGDIRNGTNDRIVWASHTSANRTIVDIDELVKGLMTWFGREDRARAVPCVLSLCYLLLLCGSDYVSKPFFGIGADLVVKDWLEFGHFLQPLVKEPSHSMAVFQFGEDCRPFAPPLDIDACWAFTSLLYVCKALGKRFPDIHPADRPKFVHLASSVPYGKLDDSSAEYLKIWSPTQRSKIVSSLRNRPLADTMQPAFLRAHWAFLYYMLYGMCGQQTVAQLKPTDYGWIYNPMRGIDEPALALPGPPYTAIPLRSISKSASQHNGSESKKSTRSSTPELMAQDDDAHKSPPELVAQDVNAHQSPPSSSPESADNDSKKRASSPSLFTKKTRHVDDENIMEIALYSSEDELSDGEVEPLSKRVPYLNGAYRAKSVAPMITTKPNGWLSKTTNHHL